MNLRMKEAEGEILKHCCIWNELACSRSKEDQNSFIRKTEGQKLYQKGLEREEGRRGVTRCC